MPAAIVKRGLGDNPGDEVIDSLLTSHAVIAERGRQLINANDSDRVIESGTVIGTEFLRPGKTLNIENQKKSFNGKITSFSLSVGSDPFSITSAVQVETIK